MRLGKVELRVMDMEKAVDYYTNILGLEEVGRSPGRVYLKAWDEYDHHSLVLLESDSAGLETMAFKVESNDELDMFEKKVHQFGLTLKRVSKGTRLAEGEAIRFELPTGQMCELYHDIEQVGTATGNLNPHPWPENRRGIAPQRIDHIAVTGEDVNDATRFFVEVLGFGQSERVVLDEDGKMELASFLFAKNGGKEHDIAIVKGPNNKLHHIGFGVGSWEEVLKAADIISRHNIPIGLTPQRHGATRGLTTYFYDPSGNCNETFTGGYKTFSDFPTITWTPDKLPNALLYHSRKIIEEFNNALT
jgi:catechol 2,3-dioxygenase